MNSGSLSHDAQPNAIALLEFLRQVEAWRQLLAQFDKKADRKRVHDLRAITLRLQSKLGYWLHEPDLESVSERAIRRWAAQGEKLRRALGPVRATDVCLGRLRSLRISATKPGESQLKLTPECIRQIDKLERRLNEKRRIAARKLIDVMEKRRSRLEKLSRKMESALPISAPWPCGCSEGTVLELIVALAGEFPKLDSGKLHEYRKGIRRLRYVAEISAAKDPRVQRQVTALKEMQTAAGEWHDWQALAKEAGRLLRGEEKMGDLVKLLRVLESNSLQRALSLCHFSMVELLGRGVRSQHYFQEFIAPGLGPHSNEEGVLSSQ